MRNVKKGFTLVEILTVVALIGILFITFVPRINFAINRTKETGVETDFRSYRLAFETVGEQEGGFGKFQTKTDLAKALNYYLDKKLQIGIDGSGNFYTSQADPWGNTYSFRWNQSTSGVNDDRVVIMSYGANGNDNSGEPDDYVLQTAYNHTTGEVETITKGFAKNIGSNGSVNVTGENNASIGNGNTQSGGNDGGNGNNNNGNGSGNNSENNSQTLQKTVISVEAYTNVSYKINDTKNLSDNVIVKVHYNTDVSSSGTTVTNGYTINNFNTSTAGTKIATLSYSDQWGSAMTSVSYTVVSDEGDSSTIPHTLISLSATIQNRKTFELGSNEQLQNYLVVKAHYRDDDDSNGTYVDYGDGNTGYRITGFSTSEAGTSNATITYSGVSTTVSYTVLGSSQGTTGGNTSKTVTGITISQNPTLNYSEGEYLDLSSLKVTARYDDNTTSYVEQYVNVTPSRNTKLTSSMKDLTISYGSCSECTKILNLNVSGKSLVDFYINSYPKTNYKKGENFNAGGLSIRAEYSDGTRPIVYSGYAVNADSFMSNVGGVYNIFVTYMDITKSFQVYVEDGSVSATVQSLAVTHAPDKLTYSSGEQFDPKGMVVQATYSNGETVEVTGYSVSPDPLVAGVSKITVTYHGVSATYNGITVSKITSKNAKLVELEITAWPTRKVYFEGEEFDKTGMAFVAHYKDDETGIFTEEGINVSEITVNSGPLTIGQTEVQLSYTENNITRSVVQDITVNALVLQSISVDSWPTQRVYNFGDNIVPDGTRITATYNDNSHKEITSLDNITFEPNTFNNGYGQKSVRLYYEENGIKKYQDSGSDTPSVMFTVNRVSSGWEIDVEPRTEYVENTAFSLNGIKAYETYTDNVDRTQIAQSLITFTSDNAILDTNRLSSGSYTIILHYKDYTYELPITVTSSSAFSNGDGAEGNMYAFFYNTDGVLVFERSETGEPSNETVGIYGSSFSKYSDFETNGTHPWSNIATQIKTVIFKNTMNPGTLSEWFNGCTYLTRIVDIDKVIPKENASMYRMFYNCTKLEEIIGISNMNVSNVNNMQETFYNCNVLTKQNDVFGTLNLSQWDIKNVTNIQNMFYACNGIGQLNISNWKYEKITTATNMTDFINNCTNLETLNMQNSKIVIDLNNFMFITNCNKLKNIDISVLYAPNWTKFYHSIITFDNVEEINISYLEVPKMTTMTEAFYTTLYATGNGPGYYKQYSGNCSLQPMTGTFNSTYASKLKKVVFSNLDAPLLTSATYLFTRESNIGVEGTASGPTYYNNGTCYSSYKTYSHTKLSDINLSNWDVPKISNMNAMLAYVDGSTNVDLSGWSSVGENSASINLNYLFRYSKITNLNIPNWINEDKTISMYEFANNSQSQSINIDGIRGNVSSLNSAFANNALLTEISMKGLDSKSLTDATSAFNNDSLLETIWVAPKFSYYTNNSSTFTGCSSLSSKNNGFSYNESKVDARYMKPGIGANEGYLSVDADNSDDDVFAIVYKDDENTNSWRLVFQKGLVLEPYMSTKAIIYSDAVTSNKHQWTENGYRIISINIKDEIHPKYLQSYFNELTSLKYVYNIQNLKTDNATTMDYMFYNCQSLLGSATLTYVDGEPVMNPAISDVNTLDLSSWDVSNITNYYQMFYNCRVLKSVKMYGWNLFDGNINMRNMFQSSKALQTVDFGNWTQSENTKIDGYQFFYDCTALTSAPYLNKLKTSAFVNMERFFQGCTGLSNSLTINGTLWDMSNITNVSYMFYGCSNLPGITFDSWNLNNVTNMSHMFENCSNLESAILNNWQNNNATTLEAMFKGNSLMTTLNLANWQNIKVTTTKEMFMNNGMIVLRLPSFAVPVVTNMTSMFSGMTRVEKIALGNSFSTQSLHTSTSMFENDSNLLTIYASENWTKTNITESTNMFTGCTKLKGPGDIYPSSKNSYDATYAVVGIGTAVGYFTPIEQDSD